MNLFIDTNILVYAHDTHADQRYQIAVEKVSQLWTEEPLPSLSVQVLQELYVTLLRKNVPADEAMRTVQRWQLSLWDALIVEAARRAGASELWSEDLNTGQDFDGVRVVNPLV